jgi:hypothetical protein
MTALFSFAEWKDGQMYGSSPSTELDTTEYVDVENR